MCRANNIYGIIRGSLLVASAMLFLSVSAHAENLTVQGKVTDPEGRPVNGSLTEFRIQILSPDSHRCVLYDETHVQDLSVTFGFFSINLANTTGVRNLPNTYSLEQATSNLAPLSVSGTYCAGSPPGTVTYSPNQDDNRKILIRFHDPASMGANWEAIPEMDLNPVAYALEARKVGGYPASAILRVVTGSGAPGVSTPLTISELVELRSLAAGTSTNYMSSTAGATTGARVPPVSGNPATPVAGSLWFDTASNTLKYYDGGIRTVGSSAGGSGAMITSVVAGAGLSGGGSSGAVSLALSPSGVGTGTTKGSATMVPQITYDTYGRITGVTEEAITGTVPGAGAAGQILKSDGSGWTSSPARTADLKSSSDEGSIFPAVSCTAAQTMFWNSTTDKFECQGIALGAPSATVANSYKLVTVAADGRVNGGSSPTTLLGFGITDALSNQNGIASVESGSDAGKGLTPTDGRLYIATDTKKIYRSAGGAWVEIASAAGSGGTITDVKVDANLSRSVSGTEITVGMPNKGTAGDYYKVTTDAQGRVISGNSSLSASDIPSLDWTKITGTPTTLSGYGIAKNYVENYGSAVSLSAGNTAGRPGTPYVAGRIYIDTQANTVSYDTGSAWQTITSGSGFTGSLGGEVSGAQGSTQVDSINGINRSTITSNLNAVTAATDAATNSTLVKRDGAGGFSAKEMRLADGTTNAVKLKAAGTSADYSLQFPAAAPAPGQSLQSDGSGVLSWVTAAAGSLTDIIAGTGIGVTGSGATRTVSLTNTLGSAATNIGSATAVPTISVDQQGRITAISSTTISGVAPGGAASGDLGNNYPGPKVVGLQTTPVSSTAPNLGQVLKYVSSNWAASTLELNDLKQNDGTTSAVVNAGSVDCTASKVMYYDTSTKSLRCQNASIAAATQITGLLPVANGGTGVDASSVTQNFVFAAPAGSAGAPTFRALAASDLPASASYWTSATGGINYAGGKVGIGTSTPNAKLHVAGSIAIDTSSTLDFSGPTTGNTWIRRDAGANGMAFATGGLVKMFLADGGNLGIGSTNPGAPLDVKGAIRLSGSSSGYVGFQPAAAAGSTTYTLPSADGTGGYVLSTNGSGALSWIANTAGSITSVSAGTGLTSNTVAGAATVGLGTELSGLNGLSTTGLVKRTGAGTYTAGQASLSADVTGILPVANGGTGASSVNAKEVFMGPASGTGAPSFRTLTAADLPASASYWSSATGGINYAGGNVGIGTSSPTSPLHTYSSGQAAKFEGSGTQSYIQFKNTGSTAGGEFIGSVNGDLWAWTNNTTRLAITSAGNVGIGTTAPGSLLDVNGTLRLTTLCDRTGANCATPASIASVAGTSASVTSSANSLVKRDGSGYIFNNYFNMTADVQAGNPQYLVGEWSGDNFLRYVAPSNVTVGTATLANTVRGVGSGNMTFNWSGQTGQPSWLWGSNDGTNLYVWNPSNFSVNYANSAGSATNATTAAGLSSSADNVATSGWYRSNGDVGWYNNTYGGGIRMEDSTWIRTYGNKNFYVQNGSAAIDGNLGIGTTGPSAKLHVIGRAYIDPASFGSSPTISLAVGDNDTGLNSAGDGALDIYSNSTNAMSIRGGTVGIGNSSPGGPLDVRGTGTMGSENGPLVISDATNPGKRMHIGFDAGRDAGYISTIHSGVAWKNLIIQGAGGRVGIGTGTPSYTLHVNGSVAGVGAYNNVSDLRLKKNIEPVKDALDRLLRIRGVTFDWRRNVRPDLNLEEGSDLGVIAQEVESIFPEAVRTDQEGFRSVAYSKLIAPTIEAIRQLWQNQNDMRHELDSLKAENAKLKSRVDGAERASAEKNRELSSIKAYLCAKDPRAALCR